MILGGAREALPCLVWDSFAGRKVAKSTILCTYPATAQATLFRRVDVSRERAEHLRSGIVIRAAFVCSAQAAALVDIKSVMFTGDPEWSIGTLKSSSQRKRLQRAQGPRCLIDGAVIPA